MASKRYKGKDCAYCRRERVSDSADHVVAKEFFFIEDRADLPQVPACRTCNGKKSKLEHYATAALMLGSQHPEARRYVLQLVQPRLARNRKLWRDLGLGKPPEWVVINGVARKMHAVKIDADQVKRLMEFIVLGLYHHHAERPLAETFVAKAVLFDPDREKEIWESHTSFYSEGVGIQGDLGPGVFWYEAIMNKDDARFTAWRMSWHGGITLHGAQSKGVQVWWAFTIPSGAESLPWPNRYPSGQV